MSVQHAFYDAYPGDGIATHPELHLRPMPHGDAEREPRGAMITVFELQTLSGRPVGRGSVEPDGRVYIAWMVPGRPDWPSRYKSVERVYNALCARGPGYRWRTVEYRP